MQAVERHDEVISHFRCPACKGWWSISEFEKQRARNPSDVTPCPHCRTTLVVPGDAPRETPL